MTDYSELVKALRCREYDAGKTECCKVCKYRISDCGCFERQIDDDAADAIEELNKNWKFCSDMLNLALNVSGLSMTALVKLYEMEAKE